MHLYAITHSNVNFLNVKLVVKYGMVMYGDGIYVYKGIQVNLNSILLVPSSILHKSTKHRNVSVILKNTVPQSIN
jgi:hypothetical protein